MTRIFAQFCLLVLVLSLVLGAGISGYRRTGHALVRFGATELVICSGAEAEHVLLDRNGKELDPQKTQGCAHCADCSLVPLAALFAFNSERLTLARGKPISTTLTILPERSARVWHPSRGPPSQSKV